MAKDAELDRALARLLARLRKVASDYRDREVIYYADIALLVESDDEITRLLGKVDAR